MPRAKQPHKKHMKKTRKATVALRKKKKRALKAREKRAIVTEYPVSPRHKAALIKPAEPFTVPQLIGYLSTALYKFDYDPTTLTLKITFWQYKQKGPGSTYIYFQVPQTVYEGLLQASSKGRFFYYNIRTQYSYSRVK